jgi:hypothetical protein
MGTNIIQRGDGGIGFVEGSSSTEVGTLGGTNYRGLKIAKVPLTATTATTGGAVGAWLNPENVAIIITRLQIDVTTKSTGAANLSVGVGTGATTSYANLIDTYAIGGTEKVVDTNVDGSTNGKETQKCALGSYVTFSAGASTAGLVATAYIQYYPL